MMGVEVRKIETTIGETGVGQEDRVEVTYELGFTTPSGGWVRYGSVSEAVVVAAEDNARAAAQPVTPPPDLSQPAAPEPASPAEPTTPAPVEPPAEPTEA